MGTTTKSQNNIRDDFPSHVITADRRYSQTSSVFTLFHLILSSRVQTMQRAPQHIVAGHNASCKTAYVKRFDLVSSAHYPPACGDNPKHSLEWSLSTKTSKPNGHLLRSWHDSGSRRALVCPQLQQQNVNLATPHIDTAPGRGLSGCKHVTYMPSAPEIPRPWHCA